VALFPARKPQYVVLVKLDNPRGTYYGGKTAAPVAKAIITAAVAARDASLDWGKITGRRDSYQGVAPQAVVARPDSNATQQVAAGAVAQDAGRPVLAEAPDGATAFGTTAEASRPSVPLVDTMPEPEAREPERFDVSRPPREPARVTRVVSVPDVRGLPLRVAVRELHRAGFRVQLTASGGGVTSPPAGSPSRTGALVRLARP
jgi:hypothetical protein